MRQRQERARGCLRGDVPPLEAEDFGISIGPYLICAIWYFQAKFMSILISIFLLKHSPPLLVDHI